MRATTVNALPFQTVHVLDVAQLAGGDMDADATESLRRLLRHLASCRMGQLLLRVAIEQRLVIRFGGRGELTRGSGRAAGMYIADTRTLVIDGTQQHDEQLATLAHELQHFVDSVRGWSLGTVQCEVRAQQSEAQVIRELRLSARTWGLTSAGALRHPEDVANLVREHPLYRGNSEEPPRYDGRVHPLLDAHEVLPPMLSASAAVGSGGMRIGAVTPIANIAATSNASMVPTGGAMQAATSALGAARPTGWDPEPAAFDDTPIGRFIGAIDATRLATGA
jgi:hypothetical protein